MSITEIYVVKQARTTRVGPLQPVERFEELLRNWISARLSDAETIDSLAHDIKGLLELLGWREPRQTLCQPDFSCALGTGAEVRR